MEHNKKSCRIRRGRILKLQQGYNPNSSSIGTIVFALPVTLLAATAAFGTAAGIIAAAFVGDKEQQQDPEGKTDQGE